MYRNNLIYEFAWTASPPDTEEELKHALMCSLFMLAKLNSKLGPDSPYLGIEPGHIYDYLVLL